MLLGFCFVLFCLFVCLFVVVFFFFLGGGGGGGINGLACIHLSVCQKTLLTTTITITLPQQLLPTP